MRLSLIWAFFFISYSIHAFGFVQPFKPIGQLKVTLTQDNLHIQLSHNIVLAEQNKKLLIQTLKTSIHPGVRFILETILQEDTVKAFEKLYDIKNERFESICHLLGSYAQGIFRDESNRIVIRDVPVGEQSSGCYGRCGPQCGDHRDTGTRYTRECLNHDTCHRTLNSQLGPCSDEFWEAAYGFFRAPHC
jgi:hypothetical protein